MDKEKNTSLIAETCKIVVAALIAGAVGAATTNHFWNKDFKRWKAEKSLQFDLSMIDTRMKLFERTSKILNKRKQALRLRSQLQAMINNSKDQEKKQQLLDELNVEYSTATNLNYVMFGPETQKSINKIIATNVTWLDVDEKLIEDYLRVLTKELYHGVGNINSFF